MPWVQIGYAGTADDDLKARLIARATQMIVEELSVPPGAVNVLLTHVLPGDWGVGGVPLAVSFRERAKAAGLPAQARIARSVWTRSNGVRLHALDYPGGSPAIIIVPGITSPAATWRFVVEALDLPNRTVVLDNRGRGWSDAPESGYTRDDYVSDIQAWVHELGLHRPILLGHSMGARAAVAYCAQASVSGLVAVDPPMSGPNRDYPTPLSYYLDGLQMVSAGATVDDLRGSSPGWSDGRLRDRIDWLPTCSVSAISESHAHFHDEAFLDAWEETNCPALFVRGEQSPVVLSEDVHQIRAARSDCLIETVVDAGHMVPWDNLGGFAAAVLPFIERTSKQ